MSAARCRQHDCHQPAVWRRTFCADHRPGLDRSPVADGLTYRQLDYWTRCGILHPDVATPGTGQVRRWTDEERAVAVRILALTRAGIELRKAASIARQTPGEVQIGPGITLHVAAAS